MFLFFDFFVFQFFWRSRFLILVINHLVLGTFLVDGCNDSTAHRIMIDIGSRGFAFSVFATNHTQTTLGDARPGLHHFVLGHNVTGQGSLRLVHRSASRVETFPQMRPRCLVVLFAHVVVQNRTSHAYLVAVRALVRVFGNTTLLLVLTLNVHQESRLLPALAHILTSGNRT